MTLQIRSAAPSDAQAITSLILAAFGDGQGAEIATQISTLVSELVADPTAQPVLSLVASRGRDPIGHVLFSRVSIPGAGQAVTASILAPLSVHPAQQNRGVGGALIGEGLARLASAGTDLVFVLGHPDYYSRYGFAPAGTRGFAAPYPIAPEHSDAWMYLQLNPALPAGLSGQVACAAALDDPRHWVE